MRRIVDPGRNADHAVGEAGIPPCRRMWWCRKESARAVVAVVGLVLATASTSSAG